MASLYIMLTRYYLMARSRFVEIYASIILADIFLMLMWAGGFLPDLTGMFAWGLLVVLAPFTISLGIMVWD